MQPVANITASSRLSLLAIIFLRWRIFHASIVRRCYKMDPFTACAQPSVGYVERAHKKLDATITTSSNGPLRQKSWSSNSTKIRHSKRNFVCHSNRHPACHRIVSSCCCAVDVCINTITPSVPEDDEFSPSRLQAREK